MGYHFKARIKCYYSEKFLHTLHWDYDFNQWKLVERIFKYNVDVICIWDF